MKHFRWATFAGDILAEPPRVTFTQYVSLATMLAVIPSLSMSALARVSAVALGLELAALSRKAPESITTTEVFGTVIFAPIVETALLAGVVTVLSNWHLKTHWIAATAAIFFGLLHGVLAPLWFFGTVWSFFVFAYAFLSWRATSLRLAILAAALPHMCINAGVLVAIALLP